MKDPFEVTFVEVEPVERDRSEVLTDGFAPAKSSPSSAAGPGAAVARLHGFDLDDGPLIAGLAALPGELVRARSTVPLRRSQVGADLVVVFEGGQPRRPIVLGVLQTEPAAAEAAASGARVVSVQADDDHVVLSAERQITLRCGDASITLTRAGKVIIKGTYVVSRSSGYNKIKGAAVDIN